MIDIRARHASPWLHGEDARAPMCDLPKTPPGPAHPVSGPGDLPSPSSESAEAAR
ncbi:hypothetical protein GCM10017673_29240 [Streptosporangium violaceochromogenes]|nr:hypothetical protein GCM10017673_29240 [Streptosporangium violaceochromogenes]